MQHLCKLAERRRLCQHSGMKAAHQDTNVKHVGVGVVLDDVDVGGVEKQVRKHFMHIRVSNVLSDLYQRSFSTMNLFDLDTTEPR